MNCVICQRPAEYIFNLDDYKVFECSICSHRMTSPKDPNIHIASTYSEDYFFKGGAGYPNYLGRKDLLIEHGRRYGKILSKYIKRPGKVLDVGAAAGFILKGLADSRWEGYGIEPNDRMAAYAHEKLGLEVQTGTIESFRTKNRFDLICFIQVIAHLIDPSKALQSSTNMLSKDGFILVETWNYKSWTARLLGTRWHEYCPPVVLQWFSPKSLNKLMESQDFRLIASGRPKKYLSGKYMKSIIKFKYSDLLRSPLLSSFLPMIPNNITIPYPSLDLFWALYQKIR